MADTATPSRTTRSALTPEQAARIERLARRGAPEQSTPGPSAEQTARLERLAARSAPAAHDPSIQRTGRARRNHPARGARAAALGMSLATTAGLAGFFATLGGPVTAESPAVVVSGAAAGSAQSSQPVVVNGAVYRNKWGPVQVEATFDASGRLTDVSALQVPNDRRRSVDINDRAVPTLTTAALRSQSASVDTVSGATYTSDGYRRSLQSAIDAARDAGLTAMA